MRFVCGDVRDLIVSHKTDQDLRIGATEPCNSGGVQKNLLSRDFRHCSICDFCNNIRHKRNPHSADGTGRNSHSTNQNRPLQRSLELNDFSPVPRCYSFQRNA